LATFVTIPLFFSILANYHFQVFFNLKVILYVAKLPLSGFRILGLTGNYKSIESAVWTCNSIGCLFCNDLFDKRLSLNTCVYEQANEMRRHSKCYFVWQISHHKVNTFSDFCKKILDRENRKSSSLSNQITHISVFLQNLIDGAAFMGVGFDGRGEYSPESRKMSIVQRNCAGKAT